METKKNAEAPNSVGPTARTKSAEDTKWDVWDPYAIYPHDSLPNDLHMWVCTVIPVLTFVTCYFLKQPGVGLLLCILLALILPFLAAPLTFWFYFRIRAMTTRRAHPNPSIHTTDCGCASLITLILLLILWPVFVKAWERAGY